MTRANQFVAGTEIQPPIGDRRSRQATVAQVILGQHLQLGPVFQNNHGAVFADDINLAVPVDGRGKVFADVWNPPLIPKRFSITGVEAACDPDGTAVARYHYNPQEYGQLFARSIDIKQYHHFDGLGSTVGITGDFFNNYEYEAFGRTYWDKSGAGSRYKWLGQLGYSIDLLVAQGLEFDIPVFVRRRWYDTRHARWMSVDPLWPSQDINPYLYAGNDPLLRVDPSGLIIGGVSFCCEYRHKGRTFARTVFCHPNIADARTCCSFKGSGFFTTWDVVRARSGSCAKKGEGRTGPIAAFCTTVAVPAGQAPAVTPSQTAVKIGVTACYALWRICGREAGLDEGVDFDDDSKSCRKQHPDKVLCEDLPTSYSRFSIESINDAANKACRSAFRDTKATNPQDAERGPCVGQGGKHYDCRRGGRFIDTVVCCPCCLDNPLRPGVLEGQIEYHCRRRR